ncbi:MAG TPA: hypothetical protein DEB06_04000, partial [Phycisphaerales bacterium]|nr:hypothetical protein [Phycisphaerales bacterium]
MTGRAFFARGAALATLVFLLFAPPGSGAESFPSAASPKFGWFVVPFADRGGLLHIVPADAPPGTVRRSLPLADRPTVMGAGGGGVAASDLVLVFPPIDPNAADPVRQVRRVSARGSARADLPTVSAPVALAPLLGTHEPVGVVLAREGPLALCRDEAGRFSLLSAGPSRWTEDPAPPA